MIDISCFFKEELQHMTIHETSEAYLCLQLSSERIYWDQASVLVQLGLLPAALLPVSGAEQAQKLIDFDAVCSNAAIPQQHS